MKNEDTIQRRLAMIMCKTFADCLSLVYTLGLSNLKLATYVLDYAKTNIEVIENKLYFDKDTELTDFNIKEM